MLGKNTLGRMRQEPCEHHLPTCPVCMEGLGTYGGPSSLPCGHNGCLHCFQQVQAHKCDPVCPLCRTPFDAELNLGPNLDFKDMLEKLQLASSAVVGLVEGTGCKDSDPYRHDLQQGYCNQVPSTSPGSYADMAQKLSRSVVNGLAHAHDDMLDNKASRVSAVRTLPPIVNVRNLARGAFSIMSRMLQPSTSTQENHSETASFDSEELGDDAWADVHRPSAPPLMSCGGEDAMVLRSILESEPPHWVPDSSCTECMQCSAKFQALTRGRHHCRLCGGIFCRACSKGKCLMPMKFREKEPQRVCDACYERLEPLQDFLIHYVSNASQVAIHDVTDITCMRGWLNNPLGTTMEEEIYKATNILRTFSKIGSMKPEQAIPESVLQGAKGLAILTVAKVGMMLTYKLGTGLIIARREDGNWSPPAAIVSCGLGWGLQVGGELIDFIVVLRTHKAVKAFSRVHVSLGAGVSASAGPVGRLAEADLRVGSGGTATCYTYSCCQGAFVGVSLEGNVVGARVDTNARFYGDVYLTPEDILFGSVPLPRAAAPLYGALHDLFTLRGL
ncbi:hypothetical protein GOP47_0011465 [Adiantum capillus-veneris]|uniref:FYVE-type domain-containing protein n=1 Tax=Adiantum capillus-veneris TaxID=13818 RepID=A0A9D4UU33_ADICA|nr:hypothetical protein GOP47_0011465 [Adiantum capillus-veneris]